MKVLYARGSGLAANMPLFEAIPASALYTAKAAAGPGLRAEYFATANFDGKRHRPRELTYPNPDRLAGNVPAESEAPVHPHGPEGRFQLVGRRAARRPARRRFRRSLDRLPRAPGDRHLSARRYRMTAFELYLDGKPIAQLQQHPRSGAQVRRGGTAGRASRTQLRLDFHEFVNDARHSPGMVATGDGRRRTAIAAARQADAVVMVLGLSPRLEGEEMSVAVEGFRGGDRIQLDIPRVQEELLRKIVAARQASRAGAAQRERRRGQLRARACSRDRRGVVSGAGRRDRAGRRALRRLQSGRPPAGDVLSSPPISSRHSPTTR